jgi:RHS repeat-associated protein
MKRCGDLFHYICFNFIEEMLIMVGRLLGSIFTVLFKKIDKETFSRILFVFFLGATSFAQVQPNLENGFKPYGSHDGSNLNTVNHMNGNWMLHVPLLPDIGQRGNHGAHYFLSANSKNWQVSCVPDSSAATGQNCYWVAGGTGVVLDHSNDLRIHRTLNIYNSGNGTVSYEGFGYTVLTADGSSHEMYGLPDTVDANLDATVYESVDTTGYRLVLGGQDSNGVWITATLFDRQGNQYAGSFSTAYTACSGSRPDRNQLPQPGNVAPIIDDAPIGDRYCSQTAYLYQVTDSNGNRMSYQGPQNPNAGVDSVGRGQPLEAGAVAPDFTGCVSRLPITRAYLYYYPGPNGTTQQVKTCYSAFPFQTAFHATAGNTGVAEAQTYNGNYNSVLNAYVREQLVTVVLADGSKWTFDYDSYLEVSSVGLPTGGSINLTWTTISFSNCNLTDPTPVSRAVATRTVTDNNGHSSTWTYNWGTPSSGSLVNSGTDPMSNDTVYTFTALDPNGGGRCGFYETRTQSYQGTGSSRQLLKQVDTTYSSMMFTVATSQGSVLGNVVPTSIKTTIYPSGKVSLVNKTYDSGLGSNAPMFGNVISEKIYDWGQGAPGALLRETDTRYLWQINGSYLTAHLLDLPASIIVKEGNGNRVAETDYTYDESQYLTASNVTTQHRTPPSAVRGNLTTAGRWLNPGNSMINSHTNWYDTGEVYQQIDPLGNTTTHSYDAFYAGAYSTQTCNALSQCISGTYDFNTGLLTTFTHANATTQASGNTPGDAAHTTNYVYDFMERMTSATLPADPAGNHPQATFNYPDLTTVERLHKITSSLTDDAFTYFDGLGRTVRAKHVLPGGNNALVDTTYDGLGRVASVTNPYFYSSELTYGVTQSQYDALSRVTQTTKQDGSISSIAYSDNCTTATDEAGKQRRACTDALGRLTTVWEDPAGLNYETDYQYDALGNLLRVDQKGAAPTDSTQWRTRLFTYDSLSRLLTAYNPESSTITYFYDTNGNLTQKVMPTPNQQGTATHTISFCYDPLNRITGKAYTWQTCQSGHLPQGTAAISYTYDEGTNGKGHVTSLTDQAGSATYIYDILGRLSNESRTIAGVTKAMSYTYNLDGSVATMTYPSGAVIAYTPDAAGRLLSVVDTTDSNHPINYVTGATYNAPGALTASTYGQNGGFTGIENTFSFNSRLQPVNLWSSSPTRTLMNLVYDFHAGNGNNGNVYAITNNRDTSRSQAFTYDPLNRLLSAQNAGNDCTQTLQDGHTEYWGNSYVYDAWGNLNQKQVTKCSAENLNTAVNANNRLQSYDYDAAGNMTKDNNGTHYVYDAENRISSTSGFTYVYDADGNRVQKINGNANPATGTLYWHMSSGIVGESDISGNLQSEYVFFNGERIARKGFPGNAVSYYFSDHLKTASVISDATGSNIKSESDYYPWGGELQFANGDSNHYKFTGKERDAETGLDYFGARHYSNGLGRFITPDWAAIPVPVPYADLTDPQSLNQYTYVRNLPTTRIDADGHDGWDMVKTVLTVGAIATSAYIRSENHNLRTFGRVFVHFMTSGPPPHPPIPGPAANPCLCPAPPGQNNDANKNQNNSQSSNTAEQGRDAQGKFTSKQPGQSAPGAAAEKEALDAAGATKNTKPLSNGRIPDGNTPDGQYVEVKSGTQINDTKQLRDMGQGAMDETGKPLKVIPTNPNANVSGPAQRNPNLKIEPPPDK